MVTATTNNAVQNVAKSFFKLVENLPKGVAVFLHSVAAELLPTTVEDRIGAPAEYQNYWIIT